jgi:hypothetical protein
MIIKIGTYAEAMKYKNELPTAIFNIAKQMADILDENYGADRDIDNEDGGYILIINHPTDLITLVTDYQLNILDDGSEYVDEINTEPSYLSLLFIRNNEFAIALLMPKSFAPDIVLEDLNGGDSNG